MRGLLRKVATNPIARNSSFLALTGACRGLAEVTLVVLAIRTLGPSAGGQVIVGFTAIRVAQYIAEGGLGMYLTREIPRNPDETGTYTFEAIKLVLLIAAPAGILCAAAAALLDPLVGLVIALSTGAVIFGALQPILGAAFLAHAQAHWHFLTMLTVAVVQITAGLLGAAFLPSLLMFFIVITLSRGVALLVGLFIFVRRLRPRVVLKTLSARRAFGRAFPYGLNAIGTYLYLRVDILLLGAISGSLASGIYGSVADPLVSLTSMVYIVTYAFLPSLSESFDRDSIHFRSLVRRMVVLNLAFGTILAAVVFLGSGRFVSLAFGPELAPAASVLRVLSAAILLRFLNSALGTWLTATGRQWFRTRATLCAASLNVLVNLAAIPLWGYWAAAVTTVATEAALTGLLLGSLMAEIGFIFNGRVKEVSGFVPHASGNITLE